MGNLFPFLAEDNELFAGADIKINALTQPRPSSYRTMQFASHVSLPKGGALLDRCKKLDLLNL